MAWVNNYTPYRTVDVITYTCLDALIHRTGWISCCILDTSECLDDVKRNSNGVWIIQYPYVYISSHITWHTIKSFLMKLYRNIETASCNLVVNSSDNGLWLVRTNAVVFSIGNLGYKPQWNVNKNTTIFTRENGFENAICKMVAILFRSHYVNCK